MSYVPRRALAGVTTRMPRQRRPIITLGSLGDDAPGATTLSQPTLPDPATLQWQADVKAQLKAGVDEMRRGDFYKLLQIVATVTIPLSAVIWKMIFKKGVDSGL